MPLLSFSFASINPLSCLAAISVSTDAPVGEAGAGDWILLGVYGGMALGVSFLCSLLEASILSLPRSHVALLVEQQLPTGKVLARMKDNLDRPLAAILTLNTIAHTIGAAGVGAQVLKIFGDQYVFFASIVITLLILYLSEIIPKGLGATFAKQLSTFTARTIQLLEVAAAPFVWVAMVLAKLFGGMEAAHVTRDEVAVFAQMGEHAGELHAEESRVIRNLLHLTRVAVADVMTPRSVVRMFDEESTCSEVVASHPSFAFARLPIYRGTSDHVTGKVLRKRVLEELSHDRPQTQLKELAEPLSRISEEETVNAALDALVSTQQHILLAEDKFGQPAGVITLEDCIETLLGVEIVDETDNVEDMRELARKLSEQRRGEFNGAED